MHENAVWIDGQLHQLSPARFDLSEEVWQMGTEDGAVELRFTPDGMRHENINMGIVVSKFEQRFGRFSGTIRVGDEVIEVDDWFGLAEDHKAVW